ncbi:MAG: type II toxin-antitoxin system RelE/ParE family toxin [Deferribacteraceae bacterium]|jgi:plasmid stabilization system protein ParE|nr:type II toxin-antitoxin system RelE/ParE family toxin [Deferribacteraceae bacterium]
MKLRINPIALQDLESIKVYIADELCSSDIAINTVKGIISSYTHLLDFPMMGKALSGIINIPTDYRFLICNEYMVFYKIEGEFISIYRVFNHRQDFIRILFSDEVL